MIGAGGRDSPIPNTPALQGGSLSVQLVGLESQPSSALIFAIAGVATGAVALGMYSGAWVSRSNYDNALANGEPNDVRQRTYDWTNGLSTGAVVGALASAGLFTVHVVR